MAATFISLEAARSAIFHAFDTFTSLQSSLWEDPCPGYDMYAVNQLSEFDPSVVTEHGMSVRDKEVQELLAYGTQEELYPFIEQSLHVKFTSLYLIDRYMEGKIPGTLDSFGRPYVPSRTISLAAFQEAEEDKDKVREMPFYLTPKFFLHHVTPSCYQEARDASLRPHFAELMHFRDRYPYVETSFLYVQNLLRRRCQYLFAYRYYGSFQGVQQLFRYCMDADELQNLSDSSAYFRQKFRKLFFMEWTDLQEFRRELSESSASCSSSVASCSSSVASREKKKWLRHTDKLKMYPLYIKQLPVHIQLMEKLTGMNMYSFVLQVSRRQLVVSEAAMMSLMLQVALQLEMYDRLFEFRHNDLHGQNVMVSTESEAASEALSLQQISFVFEDYRTQTVHVPIVENRVARIIDFGRVKFTIDQETYFSDEMAPWGAVNDHCNSKSTAYFQRALRQRPIPKAFDFAYFCCMIAQYISYMGGNEAYRYFLETYPVVFELMYECTKKADDTSFLDSGMDYIRNVVYRTHAQQGPEKEFGKKRKRRVANHRLIKPQQVIFSDDLVIDIINSISPRINILQLVAEHERISTFCASPTAEETTTTYCYVEDELRDAIEKHFPRLSGENRQRLDWHKIFQSQVLHQIRRDFRGKTQNPFTAAGQCDERDADDFEDAF